MNKYTQLQHTPQTHKTAFPLGAASTTQHPADIRHAWALTETDTDKIYSIGGGCYIRKSDRKTFREMLDRHDRERREAISADATGDGYIQDMFYTELADHEYCITYDLTDTLYALGLSVDDINADKRLLRGLNKAVKQYLKDCKG